MSEYMTIYSIDLFEKYILIEIIRSDKGFDPMVDKVPSIVTLERPLRKLTELWNRSERYIKRSANDEFIKITLLSKQKWIHNQTMKTIK